MPHKAKVREPFFLPFYQDKTRLTALQKACFYTLKGGLSQGKSIPFGDKGMRQPKPVISQPEVNLYQEGQCDIIIKKFSEKLVTHHKGT